MPTSCPSSLSRIAGLIASVGFGFTTVACRSAGGTNVRACYRECRGGMAVDISAKGINWIGVPGLRTLSVGHEQISVFYPNRRLPELRQKSGIFMPLPNGRPIAIVRKSYGFSIQADQSLVGLNLGTQNCVMVRIHKDADAILKISVKSGMKPEFEFPTTTNIP